ncbi:MAG: choice-of-anchor tandem repeat NxxGxxAF-containing protein [Planctomycetota bacterium]
MPSARPAISAFALSLALTATPATADFTTVVLTGEQAPNAAPGVVFRGLSAPVLNSAGETAFLASVTGPGVDQSNDSGIYSQGTGTLNHVAREGDQAPGAAQGVVFSQFSTVPALNAAGQTAFGAALSGSGVDDSNDYAIYSNATGALNEVARTGGQAADADPGVVLRSLGDFALSAAGNTSFQALLTGPGVDRLVPNDDGIYREMGGTVRQVARENGQVPGAAPGTTFGSFGLRAFNTAGETTLNVTLIATDADSPNTSGIFSEASGTFQQVVPWRAQAPDAAPGVLLRRESGLAPSAGGQTAFLAELDGFEADGLGRYGIYSGGPGGLRKVARVGEQAPDAPEGVVFSSVNRASFFGTIPTHMTNAAGETAFLGFLTGPNVDSTNSVGIYGEGTGTLREVARAGGQAPGAALGVVFSGFDGFELNLAGQTAFQASLVGTDVTDVNDRGIYATDLDGQLIEIIRKGQLFDVDDDPLIDDLRTIAWAQLRTPVSALLTSSSASAGPDVRDSSFNDLGQIAFAAGFTDGTSGVFISNAVANLALVFGDLDNDGDADIDDVNLLAVNLGVGTTPDDGDIDADGDVDLADLDAWLALIDTVNGDANLDLEVGTADLAILAGNFFNPAPTYAQGDFDLDGQITTADLAILAGAFGSGDAAVVASSAPTPLVPEPASVVFVGLAGLAVVLRRRA